MTSNLQSPDLSRAAESSEDVLFLARTVLDILVSVPQEEPIAVLTVSNRRAVDGVTQIDRQVIFFFVCNKNMALLNSL